MGVRQVNRTYDLMPIIDALAFVFGSCIVVSEGLMLLRPEAVRNVFSKHVLRMSRAWFTIVAVLLIAVAIYLLSLIVPVIGFDAFFASIFVAVILFAAYLFYWSDMWKTFAQLVLKRTTGWLKMNAMLFVIIGLMIMLLAIAKL